MSLMWMWVGIAIGCLAMEMMSGTFALLLFATGAAVAAIVAGFIPDSTMLQAMAFLSGAVLGVILAIKQYQKRNMSATDTEDWIGMLVTVNKVTPEGKIMQVRWRDCDWPAISQGDQNFTTGDRGCIAEVKDKLLVIRKP